MKIDEQIKKYRAMNDKDLKIELAKEKKDLTLLSLKVKAGKATNNADIEKMRKNVARIITLKNERELSK